MNVSIWILILVEYVPVHLTSNAVVSALTATKGSKARSIASNEFAFVVVAKVSSVTAVSSRSIGLNVCVFCDLGESQGVDRDVVKQHRAERAGVRERGKRQRLRGRSPGRRPLHD